MTNPIHDELYQLNVKLLNSIDQQNWDIYKELCAENFTAFEPEAGGHLIEGLPFHYFYFEKPSSNQRKQSTISSFKARVYDSIAIVTYTRLTQTETAEGELLSGESQETRVWHQQNKKWIHVHFHRS
jgi:Calcium/calmodulin dependent protein kinase II association domain